MFNDIRKFQKLYDCSYVLTKPIENYSTTEKETEEQKYYFKDPGVCLYAYS